uniref:EGF-like domain-containing protein n=1 Tax=Clastoptera arizonana TaxID=38151 RepID=A0A1B6DNR4_9HEMI
MGYHVILLLNLFYFVIQSSADLEPTFQQCCALGTDIAAREFNCSDSLTPVNGVPAEQQSICISTIQLCCIRTLRDIECQEGKRTAQAGLNCQNDAGEENKYCCEACKLGLISGSMSMSCNFQTFSLGPPWDAAYETCCTGTDSMNPSDPTNDEGDPAQIPWSNNTEEPKEKTSSKENICDLLKDELCAHVCVPIPGSYRCECHDGFVLMPDGKTCNQATFKNRCETDNPCDQKCFDNGISIECSCHKGFQLWKDNKTCADIDECEDGTDDCNINTQRCHNEVGTYSCIDLTKKKDHKSPEPYNDIPNCPYGYSFDNHTKLCKDVDECNDPHICKTDKKCINLSGGYQCIPQPATKKCHIGYKLSKDSDDCIDIDECLENGEEPCDSNQECKNTMGSYICRCKAGFQIDSVTQACVDINECQVNSHDCLTTQRCDNTIGSFHCVRYTNCGTGYTLNAQTGMCEDNDECALNMCSYLGPDWQCRNTLGSFRCERASKTQTACTGNCMTIPTQPTKIQCSRGFYSGPNGRCIDINECEKGAHCQPNERCVNTHGGYLCTNLLTCGNGYKLNSDKTQCIDLDECAEQQQACDHTCLNTWGSFRCICQPGFNLGEDNRTCIDINECEMFQDRRLCAGYCVNQPGSYICQCPQGYRLGLDGAYCKDIDECEEDNPCQAQDDVCLNMRGTYRCNSITCPSDYTRDKLHKNRCKRISMECREGDTECLRKPMSYSFHFITLVSNMTINGGALDLFTMRGPLWKSTTVNFNLELTSAQTPPTVDPATRNAFLLTTTAHNQCSIRLVQTLYGPQDIHLQLTMEFYYNGVYGGTTISKVSIFVSQYDF